ncbi:RNA polymerase sigma-70 factor [Sunxiuqinia sp. A32]|uniref:RNA polymerase sigma-70 factor n=1 Tax=Sunxiuqinia sp. A32 TaxID=3461496 RepID=UPI004046447C
MTLNDKYLLSKLKNGDEAAFKVIYNTYVSRLYYFIYEYVPFNDLVENIIQDTLMTLWDKKDELRDDTNFGAYLYTVAKNNCLLKLRDKKHQRRIFESTDLSELEVAANMDALGTLDTSSFTFAEIDSIIENTLSELPPQCRNVFQLSRFENKKNKEIADELGISVKAVEGHITKALKVFKTSLKDYLPIVAFLFV